MIENIRETALDIISYEGIDKLTMSYLANKVGLSKASLYHYYKSKEDIIEDIYKEGHKNLMKKGFSLSLDGTAEEILLSLFRNWEALFLDDNNYPYLRLLSSLHLTDEKAEEEYRALTLMLEGQTSVVIAKLLKKEDKFLSSLFSSLLFSRLESLLEDEERYNAEDEIKKFAELLTNSTRETLLL